MTEPYGSHHLLMVRSIQWHRDSHSPEAYNIPTMEPRIQYAKTKDGVSIAYWTLGEGKPLVRVLEVALP